MLDPASFVKVHEPDADHPYTRISLAYLPSTDLHGTFVLMNALAAGLAEEAFVVCLDFLPGLHLYLQSHYTRAPSKTGEIMMQTLEDDWDVLNVYLRQLFDRGDEQPLNQVFMTQALGILSRGRLPFLDARLKLEMSHQSEESAPLSLGGSAASSTAEITPLLRHANPFKVLRDVREAVLAVGRACRSERLSRFPPPIRARASGALATWEQLVEQLPELRAARDLLASSDSQIVLARDALKDALKPYLDPEQSYDGSLDLTCYLLSFWWRKGALYEPTPVLSNLLSKTDWAADVPLRYIRPPVPALFILPAADQRPADGEVEALQVFSSPTPGSSWASRSLTIISYGADVVFDWVELVLHKDESESLSDVYEKHREKIRAHYLARYDPELAASRERHWHQVWEYVIKILLYLNLDDAVVTPEFAYSTAPRQFPGFGRRKREAKLAEVELLYDRYLVGPVHQPESSKVSGKGPAGAQGPAGAGVAPHWRRGHFRLQAHGPQATLRKLMFIAPIIVRADRLPGT